MSSYHPVERVSGLAIIALLSACHGQTDVTRPAGSAHLGAITIGRQACGSCHVIPGIEGADGRVGPPLTHFASQQTIAGRLPNSPGNLRRFLKAPRAVVTNGAMPDLGLSDDQVRDIAAYLYTLK
ncbi:MAG TPA: c-type cytochrome [Sphingomonas sp.]|nr:c-type cytochrome [Sphingomonas sp.]